MSGLDPARHRRVLVQAPNWLGDFAMATPAFRTIRASLPDAHLTLLTRGYLVAMIDGAPWFDEVLTHDPKGRDRGMRGFWSKVRELRRDRFDLSIILTNSLRTAVLARLIGARERVGYDLEGRGWLLTHRLRPPMATRHKRVPKPMPEYYHDLLEDFGFPRGSDQMELFMSDDCRRRGRALLDSLGVGDGGRLVALNPGASFGSSKLWNTSSFAAVGDAMVEDGARVMVLFGPGEEELAAEIRAKMKQATIDPTGTMISLDLLKPFFDRCDLVVTTDAGPRHVAAAMGCAIVCVIGPTDSRYSATNLERTRVIREEVDCAPCHLKTCPIDHRCMERITPARVIAACREALR